MYGPMPGVENEIKTCKPSNEDWELVHVVVHTMKVVVASAHKNELVGRQWLLSDAVMDIVGIYLFCCDQSAVPEADQRCGEIKEKNENSASSVRLANNLLEPHYNILENVKNKLAYFIGQLIKALDGRKIHWWFCLILDPQYTADLKAIRELHGVEWCTARL